MKKVVFYFLVLFAVSCGTMDRSQQPSASGKAGELLLVMDNAHWKGEAGDGFREVFAANMLMFPQPEPLFNIIQLEEKAFKSIFESHRHIFIAEIDPTVEKARIEGGKNVYAYPQMFIKVIAPDSERFVKTIKANAQTLINNLLEAEWERTINANIKMPNNEAINLLKEKFGVYMAVPTGYYIAKNVEDFLWIRRTGTKEDLDMSILISSLPYTNPDIDFDNQTIWSRRDSITKAHIPGQFPGTYMTTYPDIPPIFKEINFKGKYAVETRGLWRVEGDFMGGPFVNYTLVDDNSQKIYTLDAFVFYPNKDKRSFMRQLQAIIYSLKFIEK